MAELSFEEACERLGIPTDLQKHVAPDAPSRGKMAVARGMLPAEPKVLLGMMYLLLGDSDPAVSEASARGICEIPEPRLLGIIDRHTHPKILEFLAYRRQEDSGLLERLVLLPQLNNKSICMLAETGRGRVPEIIGNNQQRLLVTPQIVRFLAKNPEVPEALIERIITFLRLYGVEVDADDEEGPDPDAAPDAASQPTVVGDEPAAPAAEVPVEVPPAQAPGPLVEAPLDAVEEPLPMPEAAPAAASGAAPAVGLPGPLPPAGPGGLPAGFVPGEVFIPPLPSGPYQPPPGLLNPLASLLTDWGIADRPDFVAPPGGWAAHTDGGAALAVASPAPSPVPGSEGRAYADGAVELGGTTAIDANEAIDLSGSASLSDSDFAFNLEEDTGDFSEDFMDEAKEVDDEEKRNISQQIQRMTVGEKIKLCYRANKSVRELLVRDTNKIVACAVVNSGRITDNEVMTIATNRGIHEEVIRALSSNREYLRKYPVKNALASNPKTPIPTAITLLNSLHVKDLKKIANNRNVSSAVFSAAMKLYKRRKSGQG